MKDQSIRVEDARSYPMTVAEAWRLLADTDHLNRTIGLPSVEFSALPDTLVRRARARAFGVMPVRWREFPFDWIRERRYAVRREFESGPLSTMVVGIELEPARPGVNVQSYAEASPASALTRLLGGAIRSSVADTLEFCDRYLARKEAVQADPVPVSPARNVVNRAQLDQRLGSLAAAGVRTELIALVKERIVAGSDDQLTGIRPFALADLWQQEVTAWCLKQDIEPPLVLKVGVHRGPAIAMTANGRLDYFGRTVNLAARIADCSRGGDVVMLRQVLDEADCSLIDGDGIMTESFTSRLRGIDDDQYLTGLTVKDAGQPQQPHEAS